MSRIKCTRWLLALTLAIAVVATACGDDDADTSAPVDTIEPLPLADDDDAPPAVPVTTPEDFPIVFPEGGLAASTTDAAEESSITSVIVVYPEGDLEELGDAMKVQLPPDVEETAGSNQISLVSAQVIVNVSEQPDGIWVAVSTL